MTKAAEERRAMRKELYPKVLANLRERSHMRYACTEGQLKAAAKQISRNITAMIRRCEIRGTVRPAA